MSCDAGCLEIQIQCCESPTISLGLTASSTYQAVINIAGNPKVYKREVTTDGSGAFVIDKEDLPDGFFGYGYIELEVRTGDEYNTIQTFTKAGVTYDCVLLEIADIDE